jgi:hypothetical protein
MTSIVPAIILFLMSQAPSQTAAAAMLVEAAFTTPPK